MTKDDVKSKEKSIHDGVSPINVPDEDDEDKLFQMFWEYLVPPCGKAQTAQGEIIRIAGRVQHEFLANGCINWDEDFHKMLDAFLKYLRLGNRFSEEDLEIAKFFVGFMPYKMGLIWITVMSVLKCSMQSVQTNVECAFMEKS